MANHLVAPATPALAYKLQVANQPARQPVDSNGFFDEAAEKRAVEEMADTLRLMLNPN